MINVRSEIENEHHALLSQYCRNNHIHIKQYIKDLIIRDLKKRQIIVDEKEPVDSIYSPELDKLLILVSDITSVTYEQIRSKSRKFDITFARHIFVFYATLITHIPRKLLGQYLNRDHATIIHSLRWYAANYKYPDVKYICNQVEEKLEINTKVKNFLINKYNKPQYRPEKIIDQEIRQTRRKTRAENKAHEIERLYRKNLHPLGQLA